MRDETRSGNVRNKSIDNLLGPGPGERQAREPGPGKRTGMGGRKSRWPGRRTRRRRSAGGWICCSMEQLCVNQNPTPVKVHLCVSGEKPKNGFIEINFDGLKLNDGSTSAGFITRQA